jgi:hypothetical protein
LFVLGARDFLLARACVFSRVLPLFSYLRHSCCPDPPQPCTTLGVPVLPGEHSGRRTRHPESGGIYHFCLTRISQSRIFVFFDSTGWVFSGINLSMDQWINISIYQSPDNKTCIIVRQNTDPWYNH